MYEKRMLWLLRKGRVVRPVLCATFHGWCQGLTSCLTRNNVFVGAQFLVREIVPNRRVTGRPRTRAAHGCARHVLKPNGGGAWICAHVGKDRLGSHKRSVSALNRMEPALVSYVMHTICEPSTS
jgi:hypothetical protein